MEHGGYKQEKSVSDASDSASGSRQARWAIPVMIALVGVAALGVGYGLRQENQVSQMTGRQNETNTEMAQMRAQMDTLNSKLSDALAAQQQQAARAQEAAAQQAAPAKSNGARRSAGAGNSKQFNQLRAQVTEQEKQLQDTRDALDKTRSDLETSLSATRDDLNGSIARTHEEVVALAKRGERNYVEFDLVKHAGYERSGPVSLSLRKADTKHQRFDVDLIVDDAQLTKKSVNLYEPIWLHRSDDPQPVQIVVNKITKDHVHGYVSAPKYRQSELSNVSYTQPGNSAPANSSGAPASTVPNTQPNPQSTNPPSTTPNPPGSTPPNQ